LVLFPLACLLHLSAIDSLNNAKREEYVKDFEENSIRSLSTKTILIKKEIESIEADLLANSTVYQEDGLIKEKRAAINRLNALLVKETAEHNRSQEEQLLHYREEIEDKYFLVLSFKAVTRMPFFVFSFFIIAFLLFIPHFMLYKLKIKSGSTYSKFSTDYYREIIDNEFKQTTAEGYKFLDTKFGYNPKGYSKYVYWENPPYCTIPHKPFADRKPVGLDTYLKSFETDIISEDKK
jgi:hypothetical protein